jgi:hypothetical protein
MPSKSKAQARLMAMAAHDPVKAAETGVPLGVAKKFNRADDRTGLLSRAMRRAKGGSVDGKAVRGKTRAK